MIKFENVTKTYKDGTVALENIDLEINASEFVFLVGPSGAGKTTLAKLLVREDIPTSGNVFLDGIDVSKINAKELPELRRKVGMVFQDFKLLPSKNVFENVAIALEVADRPESEIQRVIPNVLNLVGLAQKIRSFPHQLSGGEKQRVAIARALAHEPKVLIADEPTGNIDPVSSFDIVSLLDRINSLGTTVIMATHAADIVNSMKKRVVVIEKGKVVKDSNHGKYEL